MPSFVQERDEDSSLDRRKAQRFPSMIRGVLRHFKRGAEFIELVDISTDGCGFTSRWPFGVGERVFLGLPGLEPWVGIVVWYEEGQGGVQFERPLHPAVAQRFAAQIAAAGPARTPVLPTSKR